MMPFIPPAKEPDSSQSQPGGQPLPIPAYHSFYLFASDLLASDATEAEVVQDLQRRGLDQMTARAIVADAVANPTEPNRLSRRDQELTCQGQREALRKAGTSNMLIGGLIAVVGLFITLASLSGGRGGVIAWGAMLFGAIQFFRGVSQMNQSP